VQVSFNPAAVSHYRLLGYENRQLADDDLRDDAVDRGEIGAGHTVTAIYEITLAGGGDTGPTATLATVQVRWTDPGLGGPVERSAAITAGDLVGSLSLAPPRLQQDLLVAAFAESLRGAPWSERVSRDEIAEAAELLSLALPDDPDLAELAQLTRIAAGDSP
jgi:Ca-activated chloride channel family protein